MMGKLFIRFWLIFLVASLFFVIQGVSQAQNDPGYNREEVHSWPGSRCAICHTSSAPDQEDAGLIMEDRSLLCESCHKGTVTILPIFMLESKVEKMDNHPIKFSPLDFDPKKINHNIVIEKGYFTVSRQKRNVPLFGKTRETAVAECTTCHDPHGKLDLPSLPRIDNSKGLLCLTCHVNIEFGR